MLFNSLEFLLFLPLVLIGYKIFKPYRTTFLLVASYFFYGWWNWQYLSLIFASTIIDYSCALGISTSPQGHIKRKLFLIVSLVVNLGFLAFFKYYNFFIGEVNQLLQILRLDYLIYYSSFLLPMGISFYTFQTMSYSIEVYHGKTQVERDFSRFALYVSFFPQLVAGPIERPSHLIGQLKRFKDLNIENLKIGLFRIIFGLFKKLVIADRLALFVNDVYNNPSNFDGFILGLATFFFAFQIYCDFSGYSDIAIGTARLFGIDLMENFKQPYLAKNIKTFWSRWHISLSTWFRDYLYIPIGGNRNRYMRNILIVFLISGLWHGANWTFIIWGALHGFYFLVENIFQRYFQRSNVPNALRIFVTFMLVCFAWIFFRANSLDDAIFIVTKLIHFNVSNIYDVLYQLKTAVLSPMHLASPLNLNFGEFYFQASVGDLLFSLLLIPLLLIIEYLKNKDRLRLTELQRSVVYSLLGVMIILFGVFSNNQFIYFQF